MALSLMTPSMTNMEGKAATQVLGTYIIITKWLC